MKKPTKPTNPDNVKALKDKIAQLQKDMKSENDKPFKWGVNSVKDALNNLLNRNK